MKFEESVGRRLFGTQTLVDFVVSGSAMAVNVGARAHAAGGG